MSELGRLKPTTPNSLSQLTGYIQTLQARFAVSLSGDEALCDAREPSHRITARGRHGADVQIGSAWLKTTRHGPHNGARFLSITIDDPGLDRPLNVAAFPDKQSAEWVVVWRRRGARTGADAVA